MIYKHCKIIRLGRPDASTPQDIVLVGTQILHEHCILENRDNEIVVLQPCFKALCYVNGKQVDEIVSLKSGDRVIFGNSHVFRFNNPEQARKEKKIASPSSSYASSTPISMTDSGIANVDWVSATQELKEKQGIDIKQEMERLLALDEQYKKEVETNKMYKEQIIEYTSKINDLEKKVDIMTKSMMSSSCLSSLPNNLNTSLDNESNVSSTTMGEDDSNSQGIGGNGDNFWSEHEYRLALWAFKRWKYHQMTSLRVSLSFTLFLFLFMFKSCDCQ